MSNHRAAAACPYQPPTAPGRRKRREVPRKEASLSCGHTKPHSGGHRLIFYQKLLICKTALGPVIQTRLYGTVTSIMIQDCKVMSERK